MVSNPVVVGVCGGESRVASCYGDGGEEVSGLDERKHVVLVALPLAGCHRGVPVVASSVMVGVLC